MNENNVFRIAVVLGDSNSSNFESNLGKLIVYELSESYGKNMDSLAIVDMIKKDFSLEFSIEEIEKACEKNKHVICTKQDKSNQKLYYTIFEKEYNKYKSKKRVDIDEFIERFISSSEDEYNFSEVKDLIYRFLYETFNSDKSIVMDFINPSNTKQTNKILENKFSSDQANTINRFLNWDYEPKNIFILNLICSCFEYCLLTVKKSTKSFADIFRGKVFFLDSNIIFRLAGFNNEDRKTVMTAFVDKCLDAGIKLSYTNITFSEIKSTIDYRVKKIKNTIGGHEPLSVKAMRLMGSQYNNLDFYEQYVEWCKRNKTGDFLGFKRYLEKEINAVLNPFKMVVIDKKYEKNDNYEYLINSFSEYKEKHYRNTYKQAIKVDIDNYMYILDINSGGQATTFSEVGRYFITADHCLVDWSVVQRPGAIPYFVLPSVWYSILLKYRGRAKNDYLAFCQFLNIRIAPEEDKLKDIKESIMPYIMNIKEDVSVKEEMIYDIVEKLNSSNEIDNIPQYVEKVHETIIEKRLNDLKNEYDSKIESLTNQLNSENKEENRLSYLEGQKDIIAKQAEKIVQKNRRVRMILNVGIIITIILLICTFVFGLIGKKQPQDINNVMQWLNDNQGVLEILLLIISVLLGAISKVLSYLNILSTDVNVVTKRLEKNYKEN